MEIPPASPGVTSAPPTGQNIQYEECWFPGLNWVYFVGNHCKNIEHTERKMETEAYSQMRMGEGGKYHPRDHRNPMAPPGPLRMRMRIGVSGWGVLNPRVPSKCISVREHSIADRTLCRPAATPYSVQRRTEGSLSPPGPAIASHIEFATIDFPQFSNGADRPIMAKRPQIDSGVIE
jgi:hypothetical protein